MTALYVYFISKHILPPRCLNLHTMAAPQSPPQHSSPTCPTEGWRQLVLSSGPLCSSLVIFLS